MSGYGWLLALCALPTLLFGQIIPWTDPEIPTSPPPSTMGQQMGSVVTIGQPPLGYELDGNVKVFTLIAQPITAELTDGVAKYWGVIPEQNRYTGPATCPTTRRV